MDNSASHRFTPLCLSSCCSFELQCPSLTPGHPPLLWHAHRDHNHAPSAKENSSLNQSAHSSVREYAHSRSTVGVFRFVSLARLSLLMGRHYFTDLKVRSIQHRASCEEVLNKCWEPKFIKHKCWTRGSHSGALFTTSRSLQERKNSKNKKARKTRQDISKASIQGMLCTAQRLPERQWLGHKSPRWDQQCAGAVPFPAPRLGIPCGQLGVRHSESIYTVAIGKWCKVWREVGFVLLFPILNCTIHWSLVYSLHYATITAIKLQNILITPKRSPHPLAVTPHTPSLRPWQYFLFFQSWLLNTYNTPLLGTHLFL